MPDRPALIRREIDMKRLLSLAVMFATAAALVVPALAAHAQNKSLEIYVAGADQPTLDWFNKTAFPAFEAANPGTTVSIITGGWGDFDTSVSGWMTTAVARTSYTSARNTPRPMASCWPICRR